MLAGPWATLGELLVWRWEGLVTPWEQEDERDNVSGLSTEELLQCMGLWACMGPPRWQQDLGEISELSYTLLSNPKPRFFTKSEPWP